MNGNNIVAALPEVNAVGNQDVSRWRSLVSGLLGVVVQVLQDHWRLVSPVGLGCLSQVRLLLNSEGPVAEEWGLHFLVVQVDQECLLRLEIHF